MSPLSLGCAEREVTYSVPHSTWHRVMLNKSLLWSEVGQLPGRAQGWLQRPVTCPSLSLSLLGHINHSGRCYGEGSGITPRQSRWYGNMVEVLYHACILFGSMMGLCAVNRVSLKTVCQWVVWGGGQTKLQVAGHLGGGGCGGGGLSASFEDSGFPCAAEATGGRALSWQHSQVSCGGEDGQGSVRGLEGEGRGSARPWVGRVLGE